MRRKELSCCGAAALFVWIASTSAQPVNVTQWVTAALNAADQDKACTRDVHTGAAFLAMKICQLGLERAALPAPIRDLFDAYAARVRRVIGKYEKTYHEILLDPRNDDFSWVMQYNTLEKRERVRFLVAVKKKLARSDEVKLTDRGGTFLVPVVVNGRLNLDFVLDSGASEVQIPEDVFRTLYRTGTVSDADFLGTETYTLADGSKVPSARFMLHTLEVGGHTISNVAATVGTTISEPLLGQSFLSQLGSWTLDNQRHVLVLSERP